MRIKIGPYYSPMLSASSPPFSSHRWKLLKLQVLHGRSLLPRKAIGPSRWQRAAAIIHCSGDSKMASLRTCKNCKKQFDPSLNNPSACRFHTAHFGGETARKFESVYKGGTMNTPHSGKVLQYWHCCGSEDPFDTGCTAAPHCSYDD